MGEKPTEDDKNEPSLQLPSLSLRGLGRKRVKKQTKPSAATNEPEVSPGQASSTAPAAPVPTPVPTPRPVPEPQPVHTPDRVPEPAPATASAQSPVAHQPTTPVHDEPVHGQPVRDQPVRDQPTAPIPMPVGASSAPHDDDREGEGAAGAPDQRQRGSKFSRPSLPAMPGIPKLPAIPGRVAAAITGAVVGLAGAVLTYLGLLGCEAARGTSSCGRPGFFLLLAVVALMALLGAALLNAWKISESGSTSLLAVAVLAVVALAVLTDLLFSGWMFLVLPIVGAGTYVLSHWVTTTFGDEPPGPDRSRQETHAMDVR